MVRQPVPRGPRIEAADQARPCDLPLRDGVVLTARERCMFDLHRARCTPGDRCMVECLANEDQRTRYVDGTTAIIGGGCEHICYGYNARGFGDEPPLAGLERCRQLPLDPRVLQ